MKGFKRISVKMDERYEKELIKRKKKQEFAGKEKIISAKDLTKIKYKPKAPPIDIVYKSEKKSPKKRKTNRKHKAQKIGGMDLDKLVPSARANYPLFKLCLGLTDRECSAMIDIYRERCKHAESYEEVKKYRRDLKIIDGVRHIIPQVRYLQEQQVHMKANSLLSKIPEYPDFNKGRLVAYDSGEPLIEKEKYNVENISRQERQKHEKRWLEEIKKSQKEALEYTRIHEKQRKEEIEKLRRKKKGSI